MFPQYRGDELEEGDDVERAGLRAGWFAVEEEVEKFEADGVALYIESVWKIPSVVD